MTGPPEWKSAGGGYAEWKRRKTGDGPPIAPGFLMSSLGPFSFAWQYQRPRKMYLRWPRRDPADQSWYFGVDDRDFIGIVAKGPDVVVGLVRR